jgi:hypothetical protein
MCLDIRTHPIACVTALIARVTKCLAAAFSVWDFDRLPAGESAISSKVVRNRESAISSKVVRNRMNTRHGTGSALPLPL